MNIALENATYNDDNLDGKYSFIRGNNGKISNFLVLLISTVEKT